MPVNGVRHYYNKYAHGFISTHSSVWLSQIAASPQKALLFIILITFLTHLPTGFGNFVADDYMQWAMLHGSDELESLGFESASPDKPFLEKISDGFHFFSGDSGSNEFYRNYGNLFWWSNPDASMVPFRPMASLSHWFDYQVFGKNLALHRLHSLFYLFLLAVSLYYFYRKIDAPNTVVLLATILMICDFSFTKSFNWVIARNSYMACAFGVISLIFFIEWRKHYALKAIFASCGFLVLGLLAAEVAIGTVGYMGAYILCCERKPLLRKALALLPFVLIIIVWRVFYSGAGYGAIGIAQYIDPGHSPLEFFTNFFSVFPLLCFSLITGLDTLIIFFHPEKQLIMILVSWVIACGCVYFVWPFLNQSRTARFMFVGSIVAAIPGTTLISAESRTTTFVAIGFFYLLALFLSKLYQHRERLLPRWLFRIVFAWHFLIPVTLGFLWTSSLASFSQVSSQYESVESALMERDRSLVVLNPQASGMLYYLPFEWAFRGYALPEKLHVLTPGLTTIKVKRTSENVLEITSLTGMPLTDNAPVNTLNNQPPVLSPVYTGLYTQSFFTNVASLPGEGAVINNANMQVTVLESNSVGPVRIAVVFPANAINEQVWQWFDWRSSSYKRMSPLDVGEERVFPGPLDYGVAMNNHE